MRDIFIAGVTGFVGRAVATILRPWYVLGPGHRWPYALLPFYWICEHLPAVREAGRRLALVTLDQMVATLVAAIEDPPAAGVRILEPQDIRRSRIRGTAPAIAS